MKIYTAFIITVMLAGCETSDQTSRALNINALPEYQKHLMCLGRQSAIYSKAEGSPLELGTIASSACNQSRYALYDALAKVKGTPFAYGYIQTSAQEEPKLIAGAIVKIRQGQSPF